FGFGQEEEALGVDLLRRESGLHGRSFDRACRGLIDRGLLEVDPGSPGHGDRTVWRPVRETSARERSFLEPEMSATTNANPTAAHSGESSAAERTRIPEDGKWTTTSSSVDVEVDHLGLTASQKRELLHADPALVSLWLARSEGPDVTNPAAFVVAGVRSNKP